MTKQKGMSSFVITIMLMIAALLIMLFIAQNTALQTKSSANMYRNAQAFEAAESGIEFGIAYLNDNAATVTANPSNGYINYGPTNSSLTNVALANGSRFSVVYTNPVQNNYTLLQLTATGRNNDNTATDVITQQVSSVSSSLQYALTTQQNLTTSGNVSVTGQYGANIGGSYTHSGNSNISQVTQNDTVLANTPPATLFQNIFGITTTQMQSQSTYYANTSGLNYSSLSGKVWINSNVTVSGNHVIGSTSNPVLLIINGNFTGSGTADVYGILYVMGTITTSGNFTVTGAMVAQGSIIMSGTSSTYNAQLVNGFAARKYAKVPGSWRDF